MGEAYDLSSRQERLRRALFSLLKSSAQRCHVYSKLNNASQCLSVMMSIHMIPSRLPKMHCPSTLKHIIYYKLVQQIYFSGVISELVFYFLVAHWPQQPFSRHSPFNAFWKFSICFAGCSVSQIQNVSGGPRTQQDQFLYILYSLIKLSSYAIFL